MNEEFRADLHCHTTCSDGTDSPEEIVRKAHQAGLSGLSITDHDTIDAYPLAMPVAQELGFPLISGVEFSADLQNNSIHILGYGFALNDPGIIGFCQRHETRRTVRNKKILERLLKHKILITEEELTEQSKTIHRTIGRPHIAKLMMDKGYVSSIKEAFDKYLGDNKACFVPGESYSVEETIGVIHQAGGYAIIAHPHLICNSRIFSKLLEKEFDGLEGYYGRFNLKEQEKWIRYAKEKNWMVTGGSDFHGTIKPHTFLGSSWVNEEIFRPLYDRHLKNNSK